MHLGNQQIVTAMYVVWHLNMYDDTFYYPTSIYIEFNSRGAACDAFISNNIGCLSVIDDDGNVQSPSSYTNCRMSIKM